MSVVGPHGVTVAARRTVDIALSSVPRGANAGSVISYLESGRAKLDPGSALAS